MATAPLSSAALALHEMGLATAVGGMLFGKVGLDATAQVIPSPTDRGRILNAAWGRFGLINAAALAVTGITWFTGRSMFSGREVGRRSRALVIAKDAMVVTSLASGVCNILCGAAFSRQAEDGAVPVENGMRPHSQTPSRAVTLQKAMGALGTLHLISAASALVLTSLLNFRAGQSSRWAAIARLLP